MADYGAIRDGIATRLATIDTFVSVHSTVPMSITAPAAVVVPGRPAATYHQSMDGGSGPLTRFDFEIVVAVQSMTEEMAQDRLDDLMSGAGSVLTAIETDATLNGAAVTSQITRAVDYGTIRYGDQEYMGARFVLEVYAR